MILEKDDNGNTYLHLVMPATAVNFLNGTDGSNLFDFAGNDRATGSYPGSAGYQSGTDEGDFDNVFVELGCKVYEVNKVYYRGSDGSNRSTELNNVAI